jgi:RNA polymerase sigma-70 factor (ECF subfamily)
LRRQLSGLLPCLSRFALTLTRSRHDADDLVQMTCERALARAEQWRADTRLESWLFRIMQSIWLNELRARKVRDRHRADAQSSGTPDAADEGERLAEARLKLVCVEGLTYKEAAEVAGIPIGTVMSRLARARLTLMSKLDAAGHPPTDNVVRLISTWRS